MSLFVLNMETHVFLLKITGRIKSSPIKFIARIVAYGKSITDSSASERIRSGSENERRMNQLGR
jgi:hypothetical protein